MTYRLPALTPVAFTRQMAISSPPKSPEAAAPRSKPSRSSKLNVDQVLDRMFADDNAYDTADDEDNAEDVEIGDDANQLIPVEEEGVSQEVAEQPDPSTRSPCFL